MDNCNVKVKWHSSFYIHFKNNFFRFRARTEIEKASDNSQ